MSCFSRIIDIGFALKDKGMTGRCWHMSVILKKSKILSIGINNYLKTHTYLRKYNYSPFSVGIHSELSSIIKLGLDDCSGLSIINLRIDRNNNLTQSLYCKGCQNLIRALNFKKAYYTNEKGVFEEFEI